jgi:galactokinase
MSSDREGIDPLVRDARDTFRKAFGPMEPTHVVRAPGRVNLIGEHIDYNGLAVLPMAIQRRVVLLYCKRADSNVRIVNADPRFPACTFTVGSTITSSAKGDWGNYVKAPSQALAIEHGPLEGMDGVVHSDIPIAAGLSSSSALVVAVAMALLNANDLAIATLELGELLARAGCTRQRGVSDRFRSPAAHGGSST